MSRDDLRTYLWAAMALISALVLVGMTSGCGEAAPPTGPCTAQSFHLHQKIGYIDYWTTLCADPRAVVVAQGSLVGHCVCPAAPDAGGVR